MGEALFSPALLRVLCMQSLLLPLASFGPPNPFRGISPVVSFFFFLYRYRSSPLLSLPEDQCFYSAYYAALLFPFFSSIFLIGATLLVPRQVVFFPLSTKIRNDSPILSFSPYPQ